MCEWVSEWLWSAMNRSTECIVCLLNHESGWTPLQSCKGDMTTMGMERLIRVSHTTGVSEWVLIKHKWKSFFTPEEQILFWTHSSRVRGSCWWELLQGQSTECYAPVYDDKRDIITITMGWPATQFITHVSPNCPSVSGFLWVHDSHSVGQSCR